MKVVIVGGVAGGASAAARLRRLDEQTEIILLERGAFISFSNCGLPYYIGGEIESVDLLKGIDPAVFRTRHRVDVRTGHEALTLNPAAKTLRVRETETGREYTQNYDKLLLAPGAQPIRPPLPGVNSARIFTLRTIPDAKSIRAFALRPETTDAVVVGGGFIGLEIAENLCHLGLKVSIVEMAHHLLPPFDPEMAAIVKEHLVAKGVKLYLSQNVQGFDEVEGGIHVRLDGETLNTSMVLLCTGVSPENTLAKQAGLAIGAQGGIAVNENMRTSNPFIYATGDAAQVKNFVSGLLGQTPLAGPANKQGRVAADNLFGLPTTYGGAQGSAILRVFELTAAVTGANENTLRAQGVRFDKVYINAPAHALYFPGGEKMMLKLLFESESGLVLGTQIVGKEGVDKRCDVISSAIRARMTVGDLTDLELCYAPPYSAVKDAVNLAGYAGENVVTGKVRQYYWEDLPKLPNDGSATLLDVRREEEYASGHLQNTISIPLDELRARMHELDKSKRIYVTCQSGQRSYNACRILSQHGFTCYNFAGGFGLYKLVAGR